MSVVPIVTVPNKVLRVKCTPVSEFNNETLELANNLRDTLKNATNPSGAGLAAPQLGSTKRMIVVNKIDESIEDETACVISTHILVNPVIVKFSQEKSLGWEGCLSIPNAWGKVERAQKIKVESYDESGNKIMLNASGFFARVIQHEVDHLDGILFTDKNRLVGPLHTEEELDKMLNDKRGSQLAG